MNKLALLLGTLIIITGCEFHTYEDEAPMRPAVRPHYAIDTYYGPECYNADYEYSVNYRTYVCEWRCASYGGYNRTGLEIRFEEYYNDWRITEYFRNQNCY